MENKMKFYTDVPEKVQEVLNRLNVDSSNYDIQEIPNYRPPDSGSQKRNVVSTVNVSEEIRNEIQRALNLDDVLEGVCHGWTARDYRT